MELAGVRLELGPHLSPRIIEVLCEGRYERDELRMVREALAPDDVVMELGTGLGFLATYCAKQIGSARVYTFEANPALEPAIRRTFELNGVSPHLDMCLLGREEGSQEFFVESDFWSSSIVRRSHGARLVTVPMKSLQAQLEQIKPTFLIVDVEGGEYELVNQLGYPTVRKLAIELHARVIGRDKTDAVRKALSDNGFAFVPALSAGNEQLFFIREVAGRARCSESHDFKERETAA